MREPSNPHKLKYAQDFDKSTNALQKTPYMKDEDKRCAQADSAVMRQKKHY